MATNALFITAQVYLMSKNYWCVQRGAFPTICKGKAGLKQTTTGSEMGSSTARRRADRFPLHQSWVSAAASPAGTGHAFEPISRFPNVALKKLRLAASQRNTFLLLVLACILGYIPHFSHLRANTIAYTGCVLLARPVVSKQYIIHVFRWGSAAYLQNQIDDYPFQDLMLLF